MEYTLFTKLAAEFVGTAVLMVFGNGAVANAELKNTKGYHAGWLNIAMEEYESFDDIINDVNDKYIDKVILTLWSEFRRTGTLPHGEVVRLRSRFRPYYDEFLAGEHPVSDAYLQEIRAERPSKEALARELWLQTEHLWSLFPGFVEALRKA